MSANNKLPVDQVYVLVSWSDVLELDPRWAVKLDGVLDIFAPLPHEFDLHARLLQYLANGRIVGKLVSFYVPARREPHPELAVEMQEYSALPYHEDRDRKVPT